MDGVLKDGEKLWLPLIPRAASQVSQPITLVERTSKQDYLFSNNWIYLPVEANSLKSYDYYPEIFQKQILQSQIIQEFIVPKDFQLPRDLAILAGRLPLKLKAVELASEREMNYRARIQEAEEKKIFDFLAYSNEDRKLFNISLVKADEQTTNVEPQILEIQPSNNQQFSYLSNMRKLDGVTYLIERNKAKIYQIKNTQGQKLFDARKPNLTGAESKSSLVVEEFLSLKDFELDASIEDLLISRENKNAYILTSNKNALVIINYENKKLIKVIDLPAMCSGMQMISRSSLEPDKVIFYSRAKNKIYVVNTFDYRIGQEIDLTNVHDQYRFIPHSILVTSEYVFVATEAVSRDPKLNGQIYGKLLVLDVITGNFTRLLDLNSLPTQMLLTADNHIVLMSESAQGLVSIKKINAKDNNALVAELDLDADFAYPKTFDLGSSGAFLVVPSSANPVIGLVDIQAMKLVKKINLTSKIQIVRSI